MKESLREFISGKGVDPTTASLVESACCLHYQPYQGSVCSDHINIVAQIFEKGFVSQEDFTSVVEFFPGLVVNPGLTRKVLIEKGRLSIDEFISKLRLAS